MPGERFLTHRSSDDSGASYLTIGIPISPAWPTINPPSWIAMSPYFNGEKSAGRM
jgi:hypothetical protein